MKKAGRKNNYEMLVKPRLQEIGWWRRDGLIEEEICKRLGVGFSTFQEYKKQHQELLETIKNGKKESNFQMEDSLFKRGNGFEFTETKTVVDPRKMDEKGRPIILRVERTTKYFPPDTAAAFIYLKNCWPEKYKDKHEIEHSGGIRGRFDFSSLSDEKLEEEVTKLMK